MIYGLYLSATGIMTNSYRQDVISNNLANSETSGFKRDATSFRERMTAAQQNRNPADWSDSALGGLTGGTFAQPNHIDFEQGPIEETGSPLDVALQGDGFFGVEDGGKMRLTRDGRFQLDRNGALTMSDGRAVLDQAGKPITLTPDTPATIDKTGSIMQDGQVVATLGIFDVPDKAKLTKLGNGMLDYPNPNQITPATPTVFGGHLESSNVDPTTELAQLIETQRQLEANANMIHTQDSTLQLLVNNVGKIS